MTQRNQLHLALSLLALCPAQLAQRDYSAARATLYEAWPLARMYGLQLYCAEMLASVAAHEGRHEACARLVSHAGAVRIRTGVVRDCNEERTLECALKFVHADTHDATTFDALCAEHVVPDDKSIAALGFEQVALT